MADSEDNSNKMEVSGSEEAIAGEEPPSKKLRSSEPDLRVTLKYGQPSSEKTYDMYAQVFARQSKFVDTMLSVEMKEKQTRTIVLHDVSSDVFENALLFLDDPSAVLSMTAQNAMKIVEFYDKYEFVAGLELCDLVLKKYVDKENARARPEDLDFLVDVIVAADKFQLKETKDSGHSYLFTRFLVSQPNHYGAEMFSVEHIRRLQPLLMSGEFILPITVSKEEIASTLFPKYFCEKVSHAFTRKVLKAVVVCGSSTSANGKYVRKDGRRFEGEARPTSWDGRLAQCYLDRTSLADGDWGVVCKYLPGRNEILLYKCPNSQNLECPPAGPWITVDQSHVAGDKEPTIKYIKYDN